jgi:long-chain acyl-CoA synthetase
MTEDRFYDVVADLTIPQLLNRNAEEHGDLPALTTLDDAAVTLTWRELRDRAAAVSRGLAEAGLAPGDRMIISASSRPEHWVVDLAATCLGAVPCTAYATLSTEQLGDLGRHSKASVLVLEGTEQLDRWRPVLGDLPALRRVVLMDADPAGAAAGPDDDRFVALADLERRGAELHVADPAAFESAWRAVRPEQPVTLLYTSGTTGDPKGVVLSHHNVLCQSATLEQHVELPAHAPSLAYLPLAHIAERVLGIYMPIYHAGHVHICADPAKMPAGLQAVRPVTFFGVPRVWEKMAAGIQAFVSAADETTRAAFGAATEVTREAFRLREAGKPVPDDLAERVAEADRTVLRPARSLLGLDDVRWAASGAAPIPVEVLLFLAGLGIDVLEVWGMTETTGTATINTPDAFRLGSVGRPNVGTEVRVAADGEVFVRGPLVALGYLRADGGVDPITDADGWLATGDIGTIDEDGYLTITDRKKELIITSGGKDISPAQVENALRTHPLVGHAVAIGDRRPYVTALVALDEEFAAGWARAQGIEVADVGDLAAHPAVRAEVQQAVDAANARLARVEQVKRFRVLESAWTPESGELTPTLKLRRRVITERYATVIDELYGDEPPG